jgi:hypothetical protein
MLRLAKPGPRISLTVEDHPMQSKSIIALVLVIGGICCILSSFGAMVYLYHEQAGKLVEGSAVDSFLLLIGVPSTAVFVAGGILLAIGIKTGIYDRTS